jgi:hypothetical protein
MKQVQTDMVVSFNVPKRIAADSSSSITVNPKTAKAFAVRTQFRVATALHRTSSCSALSYCLLHTAPPLHFGV